MIRKNKKESHSPYDPHIAMVCGYRYKRILFQQVKLEPRVLWSINGNLVY